MVSYPLRRPKTSAGLPTTLNDSTIYTPNPPLQTVPRDQFPAPRSTQSTNDLFTALTLSAAPERTVSRHRSSASLALGSHWTRERLREKEVESRVQLRKGVDNVRIATTTMVRKVLQGSRDMRPVSSPLSPSSSSSSNEMMDSAPHSPPASNLRSRTSHATLTAQEQMTRPIPMAAPMHRIRNSIRRRRDALANRGKVYANNGVKPPHVREQPPPPRMDDPTQFPHFPPRGPGSAARASAAEHNKTQLRRQDTVMSSRRKRLHQNDEMMVDEATNPSLVNGPLLDPVAYLPHEISSIVLSHLDDKSLTRCQRVSKAWREVAKVNAVWRTCFMRRYRRASSNTLPFITMGGQGLGDERYKSQPWERMATARRAIEDNWARQAPKAIYFSGHTDSVYCCQFDEDKIITGSRDRTVRVWELNAPYRCLKVIGGPAVKPVLPASDASLETHQEHTVHDAPSINGTPEGDAIFHIPSDYHSASILCLQFDNEIMVTGSSDNTCLVWDINTFEPIKRLQRHSAGVLDVCFDEKYIISCSKDTSICVWSRETGELIKQLMGHKGPVNAVQLRNVGDRKLLVSASGDGFSKLWDLGKLEEVQHFSSQDRGLAAVEYSDDGKYVLAGGNDQIIYKYNVKTGMMIRQYKGHTNLVRSLFLDSANGRVLSGSYDQGIRVFDFENGDEVGVYDNWTTSWILAAKSDYRRIVATSQDGRALLMDFGYGVKDVELLHGGPPKGLPTCEEVAMDEIYHATT